MKPRVAGKTTSGECGFRVRTEARTIELYAPNETLALQWVESLNAARDLSARGKHVTDTASNGSGRHSPSKRTGAGVGGHASPAKGVAIDSLLDGTEASESRAKAILCRMPCAIRSAAAERQPRWAQMRWGERLRYVKGYCQENGFRDAIPDLIDETSSPGSSRGSGGLRRRRRSPVPLASASDPHSAAPLKQEGAASARFRHDGGPTSPGHLARAAAGAPSQRDAAVEERCRAALTGMSCSIRSAAAEKQPDWGQLTWVQRFSIVRNFCLEHGFECENIPGVSSPPPRQGMPTSDGPARWSSTPLPPPRDSYPGLRPEPAALALSGPSGGYVSHAPLASSLSPHITSSEAHRLKAVFGASDSMQVLIGHHLETLGQAVIDAMRPRTLQAGEVVIQQGHENRHMYVVDEGAFDVFVNFGAPPPVKVCQYGPGTVFGEIAMIKDAPGAATVVASNLSRVWFLDREAFRAILKAPDDSKTIGLIGGVMLLINNLAGPTIVSMPALAQEAGWLSILLVQVIVAAFACACGYMLIAAMRRMPGNGNFEQRVEFANLAKFYLPHEVYIFVMICYHSNSILSLMSLIIQSGQVIDYVMMNINGCSPGLGLAPLGYVCGKRTDSVTPFGDQMVLSSSMLIVGLVCAPFAMKNLDDNVILQYLAIAGLCVMSVIWVWLLVSEPAFPQPLPTMTSAQGGLIGTVLFNFAFTSTLPSWVNEKRNDVSIGASFGITMVFVVGCYTVIGILGGMAFKPFYTTDENLFSKLNAGGSKLGQATVTAYPMLQNFTSIPVFSILIRYNLIQSGLDNLYASLIAVVLPWVLSIAFYTGSGFDTISEIGGLATSSVINFIVPGVIYLAARGRTSQSVH